MLPGGHTVAVDASCTAAKHAKTAANRGSGRVIPLASVSLLLRGLCIHSETLCQQAATARTRTNTRPGAQIQRLDARALTLSELHACSLALTPSDEGQNRDSQRFPFDKQTSVTLLRSNLEVGPVGA